jgi:hypothetical protein
MTNKTSILEVCNAFLQKEGFRLHDAGGKIRMSPGGLIAHLGMGDGE